MLCCTGWAQHPATGLWRAFVWGPPFVLYAFALTVVMLIGMMGRQSTEGVREWWSRLGAWLGIYGVAWMVVAVAAVYGPRWVYTVVTRHPWTSLRRQAAGSAPCSAGLFAGRLRRDHRRPTTERKTRSKTLKRSPPWRRSSSSAGC